MFASALAVLPLAAAAVVVPADRPTTLVAQPSPTVAIPAGRFSMGASAEALRLARAMCSDELRAGGALTLEVAPRCGGRFDNESPVAEVYLPAYAIDRTEVTVGAYAACVAAGACRRSPEVVLVGPKDRPVEGVTWLEAVAFCRFRHGRLPTEAEWEKAAVGPSRRAWPWGAHWLERRANHGRPERLGTDDRQRGGDEAVDDEDGFPAAAPVGSFPSGASPFGVLDLAGNVTEWTADHYAREPPQAASRFDPRGPAFALEHTLRGGSYRSPPSDLRVTRRFALAPLERQAGVGFRCAYDPPPAP